MDATSLDSFLARRRREKLVGELTAKIVVFIIVASLSTFAAAAAVMLGWLWFIVPLGVQPIGYLQALGIGVLARYLARDDTAEKGCKEKEYAELVAEALTAPTMTLLFMWLVHLAM